MKTTTMPYRFKPVPECPTEDDVKSLILRHITGGKTEYIRGEAAEKWVFHLEWYPIMPGSVVGYVKCFNKKRKIRVVDSGKGWLYSTFSGACVGRISYRNGTVRLSRSVCDIYLGSTWNYELRLYPLHDDEYRHYEMKLTSTPVVANPRRLRARWEEEYDQDFQNAYRPYQ